MMKFAKERLINMIKKIKELMTKYRELIVYLIVGVLTTVVSWAAYGVSKFFLDVENSAFQMQVAVIIRWVAGVLFAYVTNKRWVFRAEGGDETKRLASFFGARLFSLGADTVVTFGTVFLLGLFNYKTFALTLLFVTVNFTPDLWGKLLAAVVVIILNYVLSKFIVFKKDKANEK